MEFQARYYFLLHSVPRYADSAWPHSKQPWLVRVEFGEKDPLQRERQNSRGSKWRDDWTRAQEKWSPVNWRRRETTLGESEGEGNTLCGYPPLCRRGTEWPKIGVTGRDGLCFSLYEGRGSQVVMEKGGCFLGEWREGVCYYCVWISYAEFI